jgi:hypothetical protein
MSATITKTNYGMYRIDTSDFCHFEKPSMKAALDFCRLLGFKPILEINL